ncbi:MAG TPA: hypothetical protein VFO25_11175 [Candidatus Eremiobacteraceae bacterium]|nr:hypothetical protein [Candidatus Eremiobacteraceae bacterium]
MIVFAHIFGMPIEECVLPWVGGGAGAGMLMVLGSGFRRFMLNRRMR